MSTGDNNQSHRGVGVGVKTELNITHSKLASNLMKIT